MPPFFDSYFPSTHWLWELVRERPRHRRILGLDWEGPRRIRPSGMAWSLSARSSFLGKCPPTPFRGQISGRTVPAATQGRTLSHQTQPACLRRTTRAASELGLRHLHTAGPEIRGSSPLMRTGRWPLWVITMIQRISWTLADWLGRYLDFHGGRCGPARLGGMGWEGMVYRATMYTTSVAGPPGQTNWISQDLDSFSHNHVNQQDQINPKKLENRY